MHSKNFSNFPKEWPNSERSRTYRKVFNEISSKNSNQYVQKLNTLYMKGSKNIRTKKILEDTKASRITLFHFILNSKAAIHFHDIRY